MGVRLGVAGFRVAEGGMGVREGGIRVDVDGTGEEEGGFEVAVGARSVSVGSNASGVKVNKAAVIGVLVVFEDMALIITNLITRTKTIKTVPPPANSQRGKAFLGFWYLDDPFASEGSKVDFSRTVFLSDPMVASTEIAVSIRVGSTGFGIAVVSGMAV